MNLEKVLSVIQPHHDELTQPQRWGNIGHDGDKHVRGGNGCYHTCFGQLVQDKLYYCVFQGDGMEYGIPELIDDAARDAKAATANRDWNQFVGTPRSLEWVNFLLSDMSPWRALNPFIVNRDNPASINNGSWVFDNVKDIPKKLLYNFMMAQRFPWEMPEAFSLWNMLLDKGVSKTMALFIAMSFVLKKQEGVTIEGPYDVVYPWSFLEGISMEGAGRFILGKPGDLNASTPHSPNVFPLWAFSSDPEKNKPFCELGNELDNLGDKLTLPVIIEKVSETVAKQGELL